MGIDQMEARGDTLQTMGIQKWTIPCNWKFAADNTWDYYHGITHMSAGMSGYMAQRGAARRTRLSAATAPRPR